MNRSCFRWGMQEQLAEEEFQLDALFFDVETTGMQPGQDQIIELCVQHGSGESAKSESWRIRPTVPISAAAQAVHGITVEELRDCPTFDAVAETIRERFSSVKTIVGYNLEFDLGFLQAELARVGLPMLDLRDKHLLDPLILWRRMEPRSLSDAFRRFVGGELQGAHCAANDVAATAQVFLGMLTSFNLTDKQLPELTQICGLARSNWIGPSYHFQWKDCVPVFGFGKHRLKPIADVISEGNGDYLTWLISSDFPDHVKRIARTASSSTPSELQTWLEKEFGEGSRAA
ncbi:MAG: 3'-5' exonuclease [Bdellovibrionales bacterium]|nr:3'-5' exonuclease [Bdellovibrionales bacterium]